MGKNTEKPVGFVRAKDWRGMDVEEVIKSVEVATRIIKDGIKGEWLGEPTELQRAVQLLDIAAKFQELAMDVLMGLAEGYAKKGQV